jgi:hypothetical protein
MSDERWRQPYEVELLHSSDGEATYNRAAPAACKWLFSQLVINGCC